jgi:signal transduction histidine kinase/CheY-like chemotaxis protein/uncharacterized protein YigA (DUF484 family)
MHKKSSRFFRKHAFIFFNTLLCILLIVYCQVAAAQNESEKGFPAVTNYSPKVYNGSPSNWSVIEDKDGTMYFGQNRVKSNLLQYDGVTWKKVHSPASSVVVRCLRKNVDGIIYYGGLGDFGYLDKDSVGETFEHSLLQFVPKEKRNFFDVWSIQITSDGIYFQSRDRIFRLKKSGKPDGSWEAKTWEPATHFMYTFFLNGAFYAHEQSVGLLKMTNDSLTLVPGSGFLGQDRMQVMLPYSGDTIQQNSTTSGKYLAGTFTHGMYVYDGKSFTPFKTEIDSLIRQYMLYKGVVINGNYAVSILGYGLVIMNPRGKVLQVVNRSTAGLSSNIIYSVYPDSNGDVWLGCDNGISKIELNSPFTYFNTQNGIDASPLSVARLPDGSLYVGTNNNLLKFNRNTSKFDLDNNIPKDQIFSLLADGNTLLVPSNGLYMIKNGKVILVQPSISNNLKISALEISKKHLNILYAGSSFGISVFIRDPSSIKGWQYLGYLPGFKGELFSLVEDSEGRLWTVTSDGIAHRITVYFDNAGKPDMSKTNVENFGPEQGVKKSLGFAFQLNHKIYFTSDSSTYLYNEGNHQFEQGSINNLHNFNGIEDSTGKLWIGADRRFGGDQAEFIIATPTANGGYSLDSSSLLPIIDQGVSNVFPENNGIVWMVTNDKLIRYNHRIKTNSNQSFKTIIRTITADKQLLNPELVGEGKAPEVKYNNNSLRFEYAAPFFNHEDKILYQTWLEGFEKAWTPWANNSYKEYTNLPVGKYRFHVRALNIYKKQSDDATFEFTILSPWYRTWWAYLLYALLAILIVYLFINWKVRQLKEKHLELEKTVEERTQELSQRAGELAVINSVQEGLAKELDMQAIYDLVGQRITNVFQAQAIIIATLDTETKMENFNYIVEKGERFYLPPRPYDKLRQHLVDTCQKILINNNYQEAALKFGMTVLPGTEYPKSLLFVPLIIGDKVKSYVSLQNVDVENAFTDADVRLLETLANSMSVALENARLFDETNRLLKETEQKTGELAVINSVQDGLVREMNMQSIYDLVGNRICELFDTQTVIIRTFYDTNGKEEWQFAIEGGVRMHSDPRPLIWANKLLMSNKQPLLINENYLQFAAKHGGSGVSRGLPPKSAIFVPMIVGEAVRGSVSLQNVEKENAFTENDLRLLTTLTNSMSVALENARLFDETTHLLAQAKQRATELTTVNSVSKALASQLNPDDLIELVGDQMKDLFKANIVYLALLNKNTRIINFAYQYGEVMPARKIGDGLTSKILLTGEPLIINADIVGKAEKLGIQQMGLPAASYLGVPIPVGDEIIGVLSVQSTEQENRFNENDLRLLSTIASSVGVALKNAQLFEEVEQAKMEAEFSSKNAEKANQAKSAFLSTVSHELRTPLTSVLGFAKIIKKRLEEKIFPTIDKTDPKTEKIIDQISENLKVVISEGERLTHLINDVLDLAKIEAGKMEWNQENVSLPDVIDRAIAATTSLFDQKDIQLVKHISPGIPTIIGDTDKLIQVVINLFSNAVKFTDSGAVTCSLSQKDNEVMVSISDTGIGIAKEDFDAVFEQFKQVGGDTLTDKPKGTGLGLPICKEIVEHHGGRIWLESAPGKGSTFSFALPIVPSGVKNIDTPIHLNELMKQLKEQMVFSKLKMVGKNATILVVDDDDSIRSLLHQELSDAGYIIEEARDGKLALESIRRNRPDLIILDVMMPEINGFDVAAILKNDPQTMDIPIIILSIVQDKARGYRIGVDRYLTKPIDTVKLFEEVGNLLEQGKSKKKVMVVDEDTSAVRSLTEVLQAKGYIVVESDGKELVQKAISTLPDIIILNSIVSDKNEIVQSLRFEKGLENVLFLIYQ